MPASRKTVADGVDPVALERPRRAPRAAAGWKTSLSTGVVDDVQLRLGHAEAVADLVPHHLRVADHRLQPRAREQALLDSQSGSGCTASSARRSRSSADAPLHALLEPARRGRRRGRGRRRSRAGARAIRRDSAFERAIARHAARAKPQSRQQRARRRTGRRSPARSAAARSAATIACRARSRRCARAAPRARASKTRSDAPSGA